MEKMKYITPELEAISFCEDVITTSTDPIVQDDGGIGIGWGGNW